MESMYAEVVVKPKQPLVRNLIAYAIYAVAALFFLFACWSAIVDRVGMVVACSLPAEIVVIALNTYFYRRGKIEYEYLFCDDVLIIAKIMNKSRRKNQAKIETDNIEAFGLADSKELETYNSLPLRNFASAKKENDVYTMVTVLKGKKVRIWIEPSEKLLYCLKIKLGTRFVGKK